MNIVFLLAPLALGLSLLFVFLFLWGVKNGQNDDLKSPGVRILFDETNEKERSKL